MKKIISLLLALLIAFSAVTVAFATEAETTAPETSTTAPAEGEESIIPDLGEFNWILDLPFWTVGPAFKFAKIAFKLVSAYLKVAKIFGLVDQDMEDMILDVLLSLINGEEIKLPSIQLPTTTTEAPEANDDNETTTAESFESEDLI